MIHLYTYRPGKGFGETDDGDALPELLRQKDTVVWIALEGPTEEELSSMIKLLHLHPLVADDLSENGERPRMRRYGHQVSIIFFAVTHDPDAAEKIRFVRTGIVAGPNYVLTVVHEPLEELKEACVTWKGNAENLPNDAAGPVYSILDTLIDDYFPVVDEIADKVDDVEDQVVEKHAASSLALIFSLKKQMLQFRRVASGARDVVNLLLRHDDLFGPESSVFFQDLYDHTVRVTDSIDTYRDLLGNAMDTYLSVTSNNLAESSNRLNIVMQTLTSWSIILGSGTFIAGIYGMNVDGLPLAHRPWSFLFTAAICLVVGGLLFLLFRRKRWV